MTSDSFRLDGKVALVTGAAQGLGAAMAEGLAAAGADICALDVQDCEETAAIIQTLGRRCEQIRADVAGLTAADAATLLLTCVSALGRVDILVNNAGIIRRSTALEYLEEDWDSVLDINLRAAFLLSQAGARHWTAAESTGKIVNIASMLSFQGGVNVAAYTAAKSGLAGLTRALANEWAQHGINVNAIAPGYFKSEVTAGIRSDPARSTAILGRIPAGRWGEPSDLKGAVVFLASEASDYVHGAILPVDGGWLSW